MKYCSKCGTALSNEASFCNSCGSSVNATENTQAQEQRCLDKLSTALKHERLCYKIYGIASIVLSAAIIIYSLIFLFTGLVFVDNTAITNDGSYSYYYEYDGNRYDYYYSPHSSNDVAETAAGIAFSVVGSVFLALGIVFLPVGIVNLVMMNKVGKYRDKIYTDCTDGANHASSVGSIILAAFFNEVALIFVIINFVFMKKNKATFEAIKAKQAEFNAQQ